MKFMSCDQIEDEYVHHSERTHKVEFTLSVYTFDTAILHTKKGANTSIISLSSLSLIVYKKFIVITNHSNHPH